MQYMQQNYNTVDILIHECEGGELKARMLTFETQHASQDVKYLLQNALRSYLNTDEGKALLERNGGRFSYSDIPDIPWGFLANQGLTLVRTVEPDLVIGLSCPVLPSKAMKLMDEKTGRTYSSCQEAVEDFKCPGSCGPECALYGNPESHKCAPAYVEAHPAEIGALLGLKAVMVEQSGNSA